MKKIFFILLLVFLLSVSCVKESSSEYKRIKANDYFPNIFTDIETGCQYFINFRGGIQPVLTKDGKIGYGCENVK